MSHQTHRPSSPLANPAPNPTRHPGDCHPVDDEVRSTIRALLPWAISLFLHAGLVILAILAIWATIHKNTEAPPITPTISTLTDTPSIPLNTSPTPPLPTPNTDAVSRAITPPLDRRTLSSTTPNNPAQLLTGAQSPAFATPGPLGLDDAPLSGGGGGPSDTMFGPTPRSADARKIVYLIDASGSLLDTLPFVIQHLQKTILQLDPRQNFTVIFFKGDDVIEPPPAGLRPATDDAKQAITRWIDLASGHVVPAGTSSPIPALQRAMSYRPDLIFLLSDNITGQGQYQLNQQTLLSQINQTNTTKTRINTIQFIYPDPLVSDGLEPTMQLISRATGGLYRFIDSRDLGLR